VTNPLEGSDHTTGTGWNTQRHSVNSHGKEQSTVSSTCAPLERRGTCVSFFGNGPNFVSNDWKKLSQFGHDVWKGWLVHAVTSFNTIMGQLSKMSQLKKKPSVECYAGKAIQIFWTWSAHHRGRKSVCNVDVVQICARFLVVLSIYAFNTGNKHNNNAHCKINNNVHYKFEY